MMREPLFYAYFIAVIILFTTFGLGGQTLATHGPVMFFALSLGAIVYVTGHFLSMIVVSFFTPEDRVMVYHSFWGMFVSTIMGVSTALGIMSLFPSYQFPNTMDLLGIYATSLVQLFIFEWLFHVFVMPRLLQQTAKETSIQLGEHKVEVSDLCYIQALEHHVKLVTRHGDRVGRSRLRDLIQILSDVEGIQPHRSYWVPKHAIDHAMCGANGLCLIVRGAEIPVARSRRRDIELWLGKHEIEIITT